MAISFRKYIDITSAVGGAAAVSRRELIARLFTTNDLSPTGSFAEFSSAEEVGEYFGTSSEEFLRAQFYFGYISPAITTPNRISFARWADADTAPMIFGNSMVQTLASWTPITDGAFSMTLGADTNIISGLDFSSAADLAGVASVIQTAIRLETGALWTAATVTYDAVAQRFNFVGGETGAAVISVQAAGSGTEIANMLGWGVNGHFQ